MAYSKTYVYTGNSETFIVPSHITEIHAELFGASGGDGDYGGEGGRGGHMSCTIQVNGGEELHMYIGGKGKNGFTNPDAKTDSIVEGGYNGGGLSGGFGDPGGSGGGATDIRLNGHTLHDRIVIAGGGGGGGSDPKGGTGGAGGSAGQPNGEDGEDDKESTNRQQKGGGGGTLLSGGKGGMNNDPNKLTHGKDGSFGVGGSGGFTTDSSGGVPNQRTFDSGGGGGAGYYGGGGGAASTSNSIGDAAGGGGGSSFAYNLAVNTVFHESRHKGHGKIILSYTVPAWICFKANTMIMTDTGEVPIQLLKVNKHSIGNKKIAGITKTIHNDKYIVKIEKDALFKNVPNQDLFLTKKHIVYIKGKGFEAQQLVNNKTIVLVPYEDEVLYNIVMDKHNKIKANNTSVETLDPKSMIAKTFKNFIWQEKTRKKKKNIYK